MAKKENWTRRKTGDKETGHVIKRQVTANGWNKHKSG